MLKRTTLDHKLPICKILSPRPPYWLIFGTLSDLRVWAVRIRYNRVQWTDVHKDSVSGVGCRNGPTAIRNSPLVYKCCNICHFSPIPRKVEFIL